MLTKSARLPFGVCWKRATPLTKKAWTKTNVLPFLFVVEKSACHSSPCKNGGMCQGRVNSTEFTCSCTEGWFGDVCDVCEHLSPERLFSISLLPEVL